MTKIERNLYICDLAKEGKTAEEIANIVNLTRLRVQQITRAYGIKLNRKIRATRLQSELSQNIIKALKAGEKQSDIARKLHVSRQYISQVKFKIQNN